MPSRPSLRLVAAGLASMLVALVVITVLAARPASSPTASAAGAEAWSVVERLFHVDGRVPGVSSNWPAPATPTAPPAPASDAAVAQLPTAAPAHDGGRVAAIDRHAVAPRPAPPAPPPPAPVVLAPPVAAAPAPTTPAPLPAPAPLGPVSSLLDAVTSLVNGLRGLL
jgi:hypothetical protein